MKAIDLKIFEKATGVNLSPDKLKCRKRDLVDIRDMYIYMCSEAIGSDKEADIMEVLGKHRTTFYAAVSRFKDRIKLEPDYRFRYNELCFKMSFGQTKLEFEEILF